MRKIITLVCLIFIGNNFASAQNDAVLASPLGAIIAPSSGCVLTATEPVTIRIFNSGPGTITSPFYVSFDITGPIASYAGETVPVGVSIPPNSSYLYTFTATANLSVAGSYTMSDTVLVAGDPNAANNTLSGYAITLIPNSDGGTISGPSSVCISGNSGFLTLSGNVGSILSWGYSTDGGSQWNAISNTSTIQSYNNLTVPTKYRALVQNGSCASAFSDTLSIAIDAVSAGGTLSPAARTVCSGSSSGAMTLAGKVGSIVKWQYSIDNWVTPIDTAIVTTSFTYPSVTSSPTRFRVVVQNGSCPTANSSVSTITASPSSVGGTVTGGATVCSGANGGSLTLAGQTGTIQWQFSSTPTFTVITNGGTTTTQAYSNLVATRYYRAKVTSGTCAAAFSNIDSIVVNPAAVGGTLSSAATVCSGSTSGLLTLAGYTGTISSWEVSLNGGAYATIANTLPTYTSGALVSGALTNNTYDYRVKVMNGTCGPATSTVIRITVNPKSVGGTTSPSDTVCSGTNGGTITLSGKLGTIQNWQSSTNGITWSNIVNTTTSQTYSNLTTTTYYSAVVKNGVCASATSTIDTITVNSPTVGGIVNSSGNICYNNNSGTLTLTGKVGTVLRWEYSIDGGINWTAIANTTTSYVYTNLTLTTQFRVVVQNGTCPIAYSATAILTVDPASAGGNVNGSTTVCGGANSGSLNLISYIGTIQNWESSIDGGVNWTPIVNNTATFNYLNVATTTDYRVIVKSGVCSNDTSSLATITVDPAAVAGTLTTDDTVCASLNSGVLTLAGYVGTIQNWELSTDSITWITLANTTSSQAYLNLSVTTYYRAFVKSGVCNGVTSNVVTITVDPVAVGGTLTGTTTVCDTINSGTLTLTGAVGTIQNWESSTDGGATWASIANITASHTFTNLTDTTWFRAIVANSGCGNDTSSIATVYVIPKTIGGTITMNDTVCTGNNNGTLHLTGYTGTILSWEYSTDGGFNWTPTSNTSDSLIYNNLNVTTSYRVNVKNGICNADTSMRATITVNPVVAGGTLTGGTTFCDTLNSGTLTLTGAVGTIQNWESSTDGGTTWASIANTALSHSYTNLTDTTWFRVIVTTGICGNDTSSIATVYVNPKTIGGMVSMDDTVCSGMNNGTLHLTGNTGSILGWESSTDGGFNWTPTSNTSDSLVYNNLTTTTLYHVKVKSGICNTDTSFRATITVNSVSTGGTLTGAIAGCESANGATLTLGGYLGTILNWESSIDAGTTWANIVNTTATQSYSNLVDTTWYRVIVKSGVCSADTSSVTTVIVYPKPIANYTADTVCLGNATTFTNTSSITSGFIQFSQWSFGDNNNSLSSNPVHTYSSAGTFSTSLLLTSNFGCLDTATVITKVNSLPLPTITASGALIFCSGDSLILTAITGDYDYMWSTTDTTQSITIFTSGTYVLTISDTLTGCLSTNSTTVTVNPSPTVSAGNDTTLTLGKSIDLQASGVGIISWSWLPVIGLNNATISNPIATPTETTTYKVTGSNIYGCTAEDSIMITIIFDYNVVINNLMTPNGDGYNDKWIIENIENYPNTEVVVFNREGQELFKSESYDNEWDGTRSGKSLPDGTYYYVLKFESGGKVYKGSITILKENSK